MPAFRVTVAVRDPPEALLRNKPETGSSLTKTRPGKLLLKVRVIGEEVVTSGSQK